MDSVATPTREFVAPKRRLGSTYQWYPVNRHIVFVALAERNHLPCFLASRVKKTVISSTDVHISYIQYPKNPWALHGRSVGPDTETQGSGPEPNPMCWFGSGPSIDV